MSSGRSGAPGERGEPDSTLVPWASLPPAPSEAAPPIARRTAGARSGSGGALDDLPALPSDSLPHLGRMAFDASERGQFWPGMGPTAAPAPQAAQPADPFLAQISGLAAAQLFATPPRPITQPSFDAPASAEPADRCGAGSGQFGHRQHGRYRGAGRARPALVE